MCVRKWRMHEVEMAKKKNGRRYDEHTLVYELYLEDGKLRTRNNQAQAFLQKS